MAIIGYARVSTQDQDLSGQLEALKATGAKTVYREKISGVRADRPQLAKLMAALKPDDIVIVTKLDRLGRSTRELLELIERKSRRSLWALRAIYLRLLGKIEAADYSVLSGRIQVSKFSKIALLVRASFRH